MSPLAWIVMTVICGVVWGGFLTLLTYAFRRESVKATLPAKNGEG